MLLGQCLRDRWVDLLLLGSWPHAANFLPCSNTALRSSWKTVCDSAVTVLATTFNVTRTYVLRAVYVKQAAITVQSA